ncbi:hypothetical protein D3C76_1239830 [compost metagenome]
MKVHMKALMIVLIMLGMKNSVRKSPLLRVRDSINTASNKAIPFCRISINITYFIVNHREFRKSGSSLNNSTKLPRPIKL